jgi:hypothetical protein
MKKKLSPYEFTMRVIEAWVDEIKVNGKKRKYLKICRELGCEGMNKECPGNPECGFVRKYLHPKSEVAQRIYVNQVREDLARFRK